MILVVLALAIAVMIYLAEYHRRRKRLTELVNKFDGPSTLPLIGNIHIFLRSSKELMKLFPNWYKLYKSPFRVWILTEPFIFVTKPEDIQILASKNLEKDKSYRFLSELIGDGLATCSVAKWKRRRRIVDRAFNTTVWSNYFQEVFNQQNWRLVKRLNKEAGTGKYFDLWSYMISASFNTICETAMGYTEEEYDECGQVIDSKKTYLIASKLASQRTYQPWLQPSIIFSVYTYFIGCPNIFQKAQDLPRKIIRSKRQLLIQQKGMNNVEPTKDGKPSKNLLDILWQVQEGTDNFTDEELADEMLTIIFAVSDKKTGCHSNMCSTDTKTVTGTETTAIVDSFTLLMLAMHPQFQEKVYEELEEIFANSNRLPSLDDLRQMNFLEQCLKESLRLFSTVPVIVRATDQDIPITDGQVLPAGCRIVICPYAVHHDEKYYSEPNKWNPHNFDPDKVATRHPFAFIPFGTGPRTCLGNKYAMLSMKAQLSLIIRNFKISTNMKMEDIKLNYDFLLRSKHGYKIKLEYRGEGSIF